MATGTLREADEASTAYRIALLKIGAESVPEAIDLWGKVDTANAVSTAGKWLSDALALIFSRRQRSRDLAIAYYRLVRALRTGRTVPRPGDLKPDEQVTLAVLRREFRLLVEDTGALEASPENREIWEQYDLGAELPPERHDGDDLEIQVDDPIPVEDFDEVDEVTEKIVIAELEKVVRDLDKKRQERNQERPAKEEDEDRKKDASVAERRQKGVIERAILDAGRDAVFDLASKDQAAIAWARVSGSGSPCYFCAMLISRGAVYKTEESAVLDSEGNLYHTNCRCYAIPMFTRSEYSLPRFDMNRELQELWQTEIWDKGFRGKRAVRRWRVVVKQWLKDRDEEDAQAA